MGEGQPYSRPSIFQASGLWGPWGPRGLWGPGLLLTTPVVCFSFLAACYLFNSAREKEGSPVLRDHAHILACSPTMCPCHIEIQNHDCLKRGKWWPHSVASCRGSWERCLFLWEITLCQGNQEMGTTWAWLLPWGFPYLISLCSVAFPHCPACLCSPEEPMWVLLGRDLQAEAHHPVSLRQQ